MDKSNRENFESNIKNNFDTQHLTNQDFINLENISVGSPAGTVVTIASSQATYNTNNLIVNYNTDD